MLRVNPVACWGGLGSTFLQEQNWLDLVSRVPSLQDGAICWSLKHCGLPSSAEEAGWVPLQDPRTSGCILIGNFL